LLDDSFALGLANQERILEIIRSFILLTEKVGKSLRDDEKAEIGNLDPVFQMIGFNNIWIYNGIALRELRFIAAQQAYEITMGKYREGELTRAEMDEATAAYRSNKKEFETFANGTWFAD